MYTKPTFELSSLLPHSPLTQVTKNAGPQELVEMEGVDRKTSMLLTWIYLLLTMTMYYES